MELNNIPANMTAEDRAALLALSQAIENQNAIAKMAVAKKEKSWIGRTCDWIEDHPICTVSLVCIAAVAAECYVLSRQNNG